jgi:hypothetical protein
MLECASYFRLAGNSPTTTHIAVVEAVKRSRTPVGISYRKQAVGELNNPCWAEVRGLVDAEKFSLVIILISLNWIYPYNFQIRLAIASINFDIN